METFLDERTRVRKHLEEKFGYNEFLSAEENFVEGRSQLGVTDTEVEEELCRRKEK